MGFRSVQYRAMCGRQQKRTAIVSWYDVCGGSYTGTAPVSASQRQSCALNATKSIVSQD